MNSIIKLYKPEIGFISQDLFMFDDIEAYLNKYTATSFEICYQKIELQKEVKIIMDQEYSNPLKSDRFVYCSIQNSGEKKIYYYVKSISWISQNCVKLHLILDCLNTFKYGTDYELTNRTRVTREHKDRFNVIPDYYIENLSAAEAIKFVTFNEDELIPDETAIQNFIQNDKGADTYFYIVQGPHTQDHTKITMSSSAVANENIQIVVLNDKKVMIYSSTDSNEKILSYKWKANNIIEIMAQTTELNPDGSYKEVIHEFNHLENKIYLLYGVDNFSENDFATYEDYLAFLDGCQDFVNFGTPTYIEAVFYRNIDKISEGINPTLYHGTMTQVKDIFDMNFYLAYYSDTSEAVKCVLYPERTTTINSKNFFSTNLQLTPNMLIENVYYNIYEDFATSISEKKLFTISTISTSHEFKQFHQLQRKGEKIILSSYAIEPVSGNTFYTQFVEVDFLSVNSEALDNGVNLTYGTTLEPLFKDGLNKNPRQIFKAENCSGKQFTFNKSSSLASVLGFKSVDKSLSNIVKIIKLPYLPDEFVSEDGYMVVSNEWNINSGAIELGDLNHKFQREIQSDLISPCYKYIHLEEYDFKKGKKNPFYESKLYSSEFFTPKFIYDSFSYSYNLELVDYLKYKDTYKNKKIQISFIPTSTINSRFAFKFNDNIVTENNLLDFNEWLIVSRNNEETLYNNAYLNYIKTGYNYDVKAKERQQVATGVGLGVSIAGTVVGLATAWASGGATLPLVVAGVGGTISSIVGSINSTISSEEQINRKLEELSKQSTNVRGADDIDLFSRYGKNRLLYCEYSPSKELKNKIYELLYLTGYNCDEIKKPDIHSRALFNYIKCESVFSINNLLIDESILNELTNIYNYGFTIIHTDDISFENENYEISLKDYFK